MIRKKPTYNNTVSYRACLTLYYLRYYISLSGYYNSNIVVLTGTLWCCHTSLCKCRVLNLHVLSVCRISPNLMIISHSMSFFFNINLVMQVDDERRVVPSSYLEYFVVINRCVAYHQAQDPHLLKKKIKKWALDICGYALHICSVAVLQDAERPACLYAREMHKNCNVPGCLFNIIIDFGSGEFIFKWHQLYAACYWR